MWAVTSCYNPAQFKRRLANYKIFRANLGVPLVTVELSFNGHFELTESDADILIQISGGAVLFAGFGFEPDADLVVGPNGAWQWARPRPELENFLVNYFIGRAEDD